MDPIEIEFTKNPLLAGGLSGLDPQDPHYERVIRALLKGQLVFFLGAGASLFGRQARQSWQPSQSSCLPSGSELAAHLARDSGYPKNTTQIACPSCKSEIHLIEKPQDLMRVSQYIALKEGSAPLYERLHKVFDTTYSVTSLHKSTLEVIH